MRGITANQTVTLLGGKITGQPACDGAASDGNGDPALNARHRVVKQGFHWRGIKKANGQIDLATASVGGLVDDQDSWPADLYLGGFAYDRISGGPTDPASRLILMERETQLADELWQSQHAACLRTCHCGPPSNSDPGRLWLQMP